RSGSAFTSTSRRTTPRWRCGGWSTEMLSSSRARAGAAGHGVDSAARSGGQRLLRFSQRHDPSGVCAANVVGPDVAGKDGVGDRITCSRSDIALLTTTSTRWYMEDAELRYRR